MAQVVTTTSTVKELREIAKSVGIKPRNLRKAELIEAINNVNGSNTSNIEMERMPNEINTASKVSWEDLRNQSKDLGISQWWKNQRKSCQMR